MNTPVAAAQGALLGSTEFPPQIVSIDVVNNGTIRLTATGRIGRRLTLEASEDWSNWIEVETQLSTDGSVTFNESIATNASRIYRVVSSPD
jgi:hypothetical protein